MDEFDIKPSDFLAIYRFFEVKLAVLNPLKMNYGSWI